jgi:bacterioferritin
MKGDEAILGTLNSLLADELTAVNQYILHSEMCANWGYERLHQAIEKRAIDEMKHAEKLIARILFLEGRPVVNQLKTMHIGGDVAEQFQKDVDSEYEAIKAYNEGIRQAVALGDNGTRDLLEEILEDEEAHADWLEAQLDQVKQMSLQHYLAQQIKS